jgi:hypothetical protein
LGEWGAHQAEVFVAVPTNGDTDFAVIESEGNCRVLDALSLEWIVRRVEILVLDLNS